MSNITLPMLAGIEKALGIELYDHQASYLLGRGPLQPGRHTGKTIAFCIRLALSDGPPLDLRTPELYADELGLRDHRRYSRDFFKKEFLKIRDKLKNYGFSVRDVIV